MPPAGFPGDAHACPSPRTRRPQRPPTARSESGLRTRGSSPAAGLACRPSQRVSDGLGQAQIRPGPPAPARTREPAAESAGPQVLRGSESRVRGHCTSNRPARRPQDMSPPGGSRSLASRAPAWQRGGTRAGRRRTAGTQWPRRAGPPWRRRRSRWPRDRLLQPHRDGPARRLLSESNLKFKFIQVGPYRTAGPGGAPQAGPSPGEALPGRAANLLESAS
jgi:hypothetical protein